MKCKSLHRKLVNRLCLYLLVKKSHFKAFIYSQKNVNIQKKKKPMVVYNVMIQTNLLLKDQA